MSWFYVLEVNNRRYLIFEILVIVLILEVVIAGPAAQVPVGLLRPAFGGQDFRPPDLVIVAALGARVLAGRPQRISPMIAAWIAFLTIYATGVLVGFLNNLPTGAVLYSGKATFYIAGGIVIGSGADVRRISKSIGSFGVVLAPLVPVAMIVRLLDLQLSINTPVQRLRGVGLLSNDAITILVVIGAAVVVTEACRRPPRAIVMISGIVLMLAPLTGRQRASYLVLASVVLLLALLVTGKTWRRRSPVTAIEVLLGGTAMLGIVLFGVMVTSSPGVIGAQVSDAFGRDGKAASAQARVSLYEASAAKISESPIVGHGVGTRLDHAIEGTRRTIAAEAHNVVLDLWLQVGLIGLVLFLVALWATARSGISTWKSNATGPVASVAIAAVIIIFGVVTKALVEPAFAKFRLSLLLATAVGVVAAAAIRVATEQAAPLELHSHPQERFEEA